jgi:KaiC/GvpD/RAD55 family RecA-like ATPase
MTDDFGLKICEKLEGIGPSVSVVMEIHFENYFDAIRGLVDNFSNRKGLQCIYITSSIPAATLLSAMETLEVDTEKIHFVDCLSHMLMGDIEKNERIIFVESPTMLENIILKVEYLIRKGGGAPTTIILDSIDSLAIHNDLKILSEFLQILMGGLKTRETYPIVISMIEQSKPEVKEMVQLICDEMLSFNGQDER